MPNEPHKSSKLSLPKVAMMLALAVAAFLVLRFVFSVTMGVLKFLALGALAVFVVWLFLSKDKGSGNSG
jgi:hypothetical protein